MIAPEPRGSGGTELESEPKGSGETETVPEPLGSGETELAPSPGSSSVCLIPFAVFIPIIWVSYFMVPNSSPRANEGAKMPL